MQVFSIGIGVGFVLGGAFTIIMMLLPNKVDRDIDKDEQRTTKPRDQRRPDPRIRDNDNGYRFDD